MATQRSPLHDLSVRQGAGLQEWHGWELPGAYGAVQGEYTAAREGAALHDSSYTGRIRAAGADALDLLNRLSTNEVESLRPGQGAPTVLTSDRGRILDLLTILNLGDHLLLLTSPQATEKVIDWLDKYTIIEDVALEDVTGDTAMVSLIGKDAKTVLGGLVGLELEFFVPFQSALVTIAGGEGCVVRRDLANIPRYDVVVEREYAEPVWKAAVSAGATPIGMEAYEVLRVEAGAPSYGEELGEAYNPLETGLWGSISFSKGCYIGQEVIARLDTYKKVQKHLVYLRFSPDVPAEVGLKLAVDGREVGQVTSMVKVPTTGELVGLGYVRREAAETGTTLSLSGNGGAWAKVEAKALPFGPGDQT